MKRLLIPALLLNAALLAVRVVQEGRPAPAEAQAATEVILDNGRPGTSFVGSWTKSSAPSPFGTESLYNSIAGNSYTWQLGLPASGEYEVYAWWTVLASRAPAAPYVVTHAGGTSTVTKDQRANGGKWNFLGKWSFGSSGRVQVRTTANFSTSADAVRFVRVVASAPALTAEEKEILSHFSIVYLPAGDYCVDAEGIENPCEPPDFLAKTIRISGVNVQVVNGSESTVTLNGLGNVIVGYQTDRTFSGESCWDSNLNFRGGSHNLIVGDGNNYKASSAIVAGTRNSSWSQGACAVGGVGNRAAGRESFVGGGVFNWVHGARSAIVGGAENQIFDAEKGFLGGHGQTAGFEPCGEE